jgi:hypothetical protein
VAVLGVLFGYFIGLPQALHFLFHQFVTVQVRPLITIQSYMQFVALYLFGSALMFQLPLIILFINRIKPLKPKTLLKYERHLIVAAVVIAFIMNPSPNIVDQLFVVVPIIITYQLSIVLLWLVNRGRDPEWLAQLRQQDAERQAERANKSLAPFVSEPLPFEEPELTLEPIPVAVDDPAPVPLQEAPLILATPRMRQYNAAPITPTRRNYLPLRGSVIQ